MQEMKYFNEGNDCDICKNQLMTGRDGTVEDCRRRQNGLSCRFEERDIRTCPVCEHEVDREDMYFTKDCHGIPFRLVAPLVGAWIEIPENKGKSSGSGQRNG